MDKNEKLNLIVLLTVISTTSYALEEDHHKHVGNTNIKINYGTLDFENSKKKDNGKRYGIELDHQDHKHHYQFYYEETYTDTTKMVNKDLQVKKHTLKYQYNISKKNNLSLSYANIDDNLMKETDGGHIYGLGYRYKTLSLTQYLSDYKNFDVYQSDLKLGFKKKFNNIEFISAVIGKYIHLNDKNSNNFSKKAKNNYFSLGLKAHAHYKGYHFAAGTYLGKRIFSVMNEGLKVQHHAMEFKESYMLGIGKKIDNLLIHLRYAQHKAKEVPINNDNVKVKNIMLEIEYQF
jgi:hypothetical protein